MQRALGHVWGPCGGRAGLRLHAQEASSGRKSGFGRLGALRTLGLSQKKNEEVKKDEEERKQNISKLYLQQSCKRGGLSLMLISTLP